MIMSMKNSNFTICVRTRNLLVCSVVSEPTAPQSPSILRTSYACTSMCVGLRNKSTGQLISCSIYILGQVMVIRLIMVSPVDMGIRSNLPPHLHVWDYG